MAHFRKMAKMAEFKGNGRFGQIPKKGKRCRKRQNDKTLLNLKVFYSLFKLKFKSVLNAFKCFLNDLKISVF